MIVPAGVVVPERLAGAVVSLLAPALADRHTRGIPLPGAVAAVVADLVLMAQRSDVPNVALSKPQRVGSRRSEPSEAGRRLPMMSGVTTRQAADHFGTTTRAVTARICRGTLHAVRSEDGRRWLVDLGGVA